MSALHGGLRYYLVEHPTVSSFQWNPDSSLLSSPFSLLAVLLLYLSLTFLLPKLLPLPFPSAPLRLLSSLHNIVLLLLSAVMSLGCSLSSLSIPALSLLCFPSPTSPSGPLFFWAHVFYLSKIYELLDTLLIILSNPARLSFLHVYHHAVVLVMCYVWLATSQSLLPIALITNASVHVVMYGYYLSCSLGWRWSPRWKRAVTNLQIVQFVFSFAVSVGFLWLHFGRGRSCSGFSGWVFNAVFNASLLWLFLDFHGRNYGKERRRMKEVEGENKKS